MMFPFTHDYAIRWAEVWDENAMKTDPSVPLHAVWMEIALETALGGRVAAGTYPGRRSTRPRPFQNYSRRFPEGKP